MKNLRNIFKEYNDPKVYRDLKIGFACLVVVGVLITFAVSPTLRHDIGIGQNHAVSTPKTHHSNLNPSESTQHSHSSQIKTHRASRRVSKKHEAPAKGKTASHKETGLEGVKSPPAHEVNHEKESGGHSPGSSAPEPSPPSSTPSGHPSEGNREESPVPPTEGNKGKVQVEIPVIKTPPLIEEVNHGVDETVNGVTGKVEETTKPLPVHAELPEVCLLNC